MDWFNCLVRRWRYQFTKCKLILFIQDLLGSSIFGFVQSDLRSNINVWIFNPFLIPHFVGQSEQGVRQRYETTPDTSSTLENLVRSESHEEQKHGTQCFVRLVRYVLWYWPTISPRPFTLVHSLYFNRGLSFTCHGLQNVQNDTSAELYVCFKRSYDTVLKHHHSFFIRSVVYVSTVYTFPVYTFLLRRPSSYCYTIIFFAYPYSKNCSCSHGLSLLSVASIWILIRISVITGSSPCRPPPTWVLRTYFPRRFDRKTQCGISEMARRRPRQPREAPQHVPWRRWVWKSVRAAVIQDQDALRTRLSMLLYRDIWCHGTFPFISHYAPFDLGFCVRSTELRRSVFG